MKFLHLADLHIGKSVNGFSMLEEQRNVFAQIINYVKIYAPQAVLIAGDVYDRSVPGVEAVRVFDDFLTALASLETAVMTIAGNHDSPERLSYASRLLAGRNIYFGAEHVKLPDEYGEVNFWLVPFMRLMAPGYRNSAFEPPEIDSSERNVILAHQFFTPAGQTLSGETGAMPFISDPEINCRAESVPVGGLDAVDAALLSDFDYAAIGHLHRAQSISSGSSGNVRYAGSPLKYSFSEVSHEKSVTLVELRAKHDITIELLPLRPIHDMREIRGEFDAIMNGAPSLDYMRIVLTDSVEREIIDPMGKVRALYPNVMTLEFERLRLNIDFAENGAGGMSNMDDIEKLSPLELFRAFFLESRGFAMSGEQEKAALEIFESGKMSDI